MRYRGISYGVVRAIDVQTCWRWSLVINERRKSGQTKISRRAAEIQVQSAIDKALHSQSDRDGVMAGKLTAPIAMTI
jgi:hypothetical protein